MLPPMPFDSLNIKNVSTLVGILLRYATLAALESVKAGSLTL